MYELLGKTCAEHEGLRVAVFNEIVSKYNTVMTSDAMSAFASGRLRSEKLGQGEL